jgi:hypothetical protein
MYIVISLIVYGPDIEKAAGSFDVEKCGSDCCEKHFSAQGSWQDNKRNYNAPTMHNCAQNKENWLNYLKVNKEGPTWARSKIHSRELGW